MSVEAERRGRVLVVRILREHKRNAIDTETAFGIDAALNTLDDDADLWTGVLTGTPAVFSAGTDLSDGAGARTDRGGEYGLIRRQRLKPLIAAVEGPALGGGFEIALACDLVVAARTAYFALPEVSRGVLATSGALFRAARALPYHVAREMLITGDPLSAERAYHFGVVNHLVEQGEALDRAVALAERICQNSPTSVRASLAALAALAADDDAAGWRVTEQQLQGVLASEDMAEGIAAFFEKRPPTWKGR